MPRQKSPPINRRKHDNVIEIGEVEDSEYTEDFEEADGVGAAEGDNKYLKELQRQNKKDAKNAIKNIMKQQETDNKLNLLIGDALTQKEGLICELEKELAVEKQRREDMNSNFEKQMKEFREDQKALQKINERSRKMEAGKIDRKTEA